jgi:hypothetical protein
MSRFLSPLLNIDEDILIFAAQSDFYDVQSNSYFWNNLGAVAGNSYGSASDPNNPFTPQDFGGSSSDGFNPIDRQQQQQQLSFQGRRQNARITVYSN